MNPFDERRRQMLRGTLATLFALAIPGLFGCNKRETPPAEPAPSGPPPGAGAPAPSAATPETSPSAPPAGGAVKVTKASVQYQEQPKADQKCSNCMQFVEPNGCKVVEGSINPEGWCILWVKKV